MEKCRFLPGEDWLMPREIEENKYLLFAPKLLTIPPGWCAEFDLHIDVDAPSEDLHFDLISTEKLRTCRITPLNTPITVKAGKQKSLHVLLNNSSNYSYTLIPAEELIYLKQIKERTIS